MMLVKTSDDDDDDDFVFFSFSPSFKHTIVKHTIYKFVCSFVIFFPILKRTIEFCSGHAERSLTGLHCLILRCRSVNKRRAFKFRENTTKQWLKKAQRDFD